MKETKVQVGTLVWRVSLDDLVTGSDPSEAIPFDEIADWVKGLGIPLAIALALFVKDGEYFLHVAEFALRDGHPFMDWARDEPALAPPRVIQVEPQSWPTYLDRFNAKAGSWA